MQHLPSAVSHSFLSHPVSPFRFGSPSLPVSFLRLRLSLSLSPSVDCIPYFSFPTASCAVTRLSDFPPNPTGASLHSQRVRSFSMYYCVARHFCSSRRRITGEHSVRPQPPHRSNTVFKQMFCNVHTRSFLTTEHSGLGQRETIITDERLLRSQKVSGKNH